MLDRGRAQLDAGLDALAIESFRGQLRLDPENADAYNGLAVAYGRIGRDDLAQRYFETALAKDPMNSRAQTNLARLNGEKFAMPAMAVSGPSVVGPEPVAVTVEFDSGLTVAALDDVDMLIRPVSELPVAIAPKAPAPEILARHSLFSTRFAAAPARLAVKRSVPAPTPSHPPTPPRRPEPYIPPAIFSSEQRFGGNRLERVSLGEVRLVTRLEPPVRQAARTPDFASFGDRLAGWLPQSVAAERTGGAHGMIDSAVIMAAIERAGEGEKLASAGDEAATPLREFAYLFFHEDDEILNV